MQGAGSSEPQNVPVEANQTHAPAVGEKRPREDEEDPVNGADGRQAQSHIQSHNNLAQSNFNSNSNGGGGGGDVQMQMHSLPQSVISPQFTGGGSSGGGGHNDALYIGELQWVRGFLSESDVRKDLMCAC